MRLAGIYTIRDTPQPYYWDIVFEWEDELSKSLRVPLVPVGKKFDKVYKPSWLRKILNRVNWYSRMDRFFHKPKDFYLAFHIGSPGVYSFFTRQNVIPLIIDFWKNESIERFERVFCNAKVVLITSLEAFVYLKAVGCSLPLEHLALSIPDDWLKSGDSHRDVDIVQFGRQNSKLTEFALKLIVEHPDIDYVYAEKQGNNVRLKSTKRGWLGEGANRKSFEAILRRAKVSLVSAPGIDGDEARTGGFSPVTPRFLESAATGCWLVGVYPENVDFGYFGLDSICNNIKDYETFKRTVLECLTTAKRPEYHEFLSQHSTSMRAKELLNKVEKYV